MVAHALVCPNNQSVPIRVLNPREQLVVLKKGELIARMELVEQEPSGINAVDVTSSSTRPELSPENKEFLWNMVSEVGDHISSTEKEQLFSVLSAYGDVSSFHDNDVGHTLATKHRIDTGNAPPVHCPPRRMPHAQEEVRKLLRDMLEKRVIQPSDSPWSSPIILVKKKDGSVRFCIDYRKVNAITRKDAYPLPRVDDTLDTLAGSRLFTTLDLKNGYWQVEVEEADQQKTAFNTSEGLYQFNMMPFGLCNASATFQRLMDRVLHGLKWHNCLVYIDDIVVVGGSMREHFRVRTDTDASDVGIGAVLSQIQDNGSEGVIAYAIDRSVDKNKSKKFTLRTDHSSLIWMQNFKEPEGQLARWLEKLQEYDFSILHRQGSRHSNADALSRIPCRQCGRGDLCGKIVDEVCAVDAVLPYIPQTNSLDEVRRMQAEDNIVGPVLEAVERGKVPEPDVSKSWSRESRLLLQQWDTLICNCGVLWRRVSEGKERRQLVLPYRLHGKVIQDLHEGAVGAHLGEEKVLSQLKERFYWPGCTEAVKTSCPYPGRVRRVLKHHPAGLGGPLWHA
eukprot:Em0022g377a